MAGAAAAAQAVRIKQAFTTAKDEMTLLVTRQAGAVEDAKKDVNKTVFIAAAWNAAQIASTVDAPTPEQLNFSYMSTVMTVVLWVPVLREGLIRRRDDVLIGLHGAEIPGPMVIQLKLMLVNIYKTTNEWAEKLIESIVDQTVDLARRIEFLLAYEPAVVYTHLRWALRRIDKDLTSLKVDQLHKKSSKAIGQKFATMKRHRPEEFSFGDSAIAKSLGKIGEKE